VVHRIVSEHGGTVEFASVQDEGTTATVSLPLSGEPLTSGHVASEEGE
jgi:signal transduction histidine kinase